MSPCQKMKVGNLQIKDPSGGRHVSRLEDLEEGEAFKQDD